MKITINKGVLHFFEKDKPLRSFSILNKNSVSVYSGYFNTKDVKYFYYLKKLGIKNIIFDLKERKKDSIIKRISRYVSYNIIDSKLNDIDVEKYVKDNLEISKYKSTNGSYMSLCELNIEKLKLTPLKR